METTTTIGERLRVIRTNMNLSLDETAKLTGVSKPMLGQIERGQSVPTITTLWKIATGLKKPLSSFLDNRQTEYDMVNIFMNVYGDGTKTQEELIEEIKKIQNYKGTSGTISFMDNGDTKTDLITAKYSNGSISLISNE